MSILLLVYSALADACINSIGDKPKESNPATEVTMAIKHREEKRWKL